MRPLCFGLWFIKLIKILRIALPCTYCPRPPFDICPWPKSISKHKHKTDRGSGPPVPNWPAGCKRTLGHSSRRHHRHWKRNGSLCRGWKLRPKNFTNNTKTQHKVWFDNAMLTMIGFTLTIQEEKGMPRDTISAGFFNINQKAVGRVLNICFAIVLATYVKSAKTSVATKAFTNV